MTLLTFDTLASTNDYLKQHYLELSNQTVVRARYQTAGRGQFSRHWQSNPNENILVSFLFRNLAHPDTIKSIEKTMIQACQSFLASFGITATWKLPNDLLVNEKKISGMLIETKQQDMTLDYVILGIGININQTSFLDLTHATSLRLLTQKQYDVDELFDKFIQHCSALEAY
jgi:BirA family transcriptional regulator, biotin operon repressor / biotin---[acetyl-CoA-carboxylase] ligase